MVVPDFALICEIMLVAEGFLESRLLARKFITLYTLCKELLSKQVMPQETFRSLQLWVDHAVGTDTVLPISRRLFLLYDRCYGREYCTDEKKNLNYCLVPLPSILNYWKICCFVYIYGLPMNSFFLDCLKPSATQPHCDTRFTVQLETKEQTYAMLMHQVNKHGKIK